MALVIFTSPKVVPPPKISPWYGIGMEWIDAAGVVWSLTDWQSGVTVTDGVEGLHDPEVERFASESRAFHGSRKRGFRVLPRECFWPTFVWGESSGVWYDRYQAFLGGLLPGAVGTWRVRTPRSVRTLRLEVTAGSPHAYGHDPLRAGWELYPLEFVAEQPFWEGEVVRRGPWNGTAADGFYSGAGGVVTISAASRIGEAVMDNPGDVEAYATWRAVGPLSGLELGVGDRVIEVPFSLDTGESLVIQTDPRLVTATVDGVDVTASLGFQDLAPIPPGQGVPIVVEATGLGTVSCELVPLYYRAM